MIASSTCRYGYLAYGLGASSYVNGSRFTRPRKLKQWESYVDSLSSYKVQVDTASLGGLGSVDRLLDAIMLGLRLKRGVDLQWLQRSFGVARLRQVLWAMPTHIAEGRAEVVGDGRAWSCEEALEKLRCSDSGEPLALRLTDPHGFLTSNDIISDVFLQIGNFPDR